MNTHEEYVTYAQAKALKELGFDWPCRTSYYTSKLNPNGRFIRTCQNDCNSETPSHWYSAPTQAVACRWLREEKEMVVEAVYKGPRHKWSFRRWIEEGLIEYPDYPTYETALYAGIDRALKMLKGGEV